MFRTQKLAVVEVLQYPLDYIGLRFHPRSSHSSAVTTKPFETGMNRIHADV